MSPRATLISTALGFIRARRWASTRPRVSAVSGQATRRKSTSGKRATSSIIGAAPGHGAELDRIVAGAGDLQQLELRRRRQLAVEMMGEDRRGLGEGGGDRGAIGALRHRHDAPLGGEQRAQVARMLRRVVAEEDDGWDAAAIFHAGEDGN